MNHYFCLACQKLPLRLSSFHVDLTNAVQQRIVTIKNRLGLHARAAARLVRVAGTYQSRIELSRTDARQTPVDAKSIFGVLLLAATQHTEIEITASGEDEAEAVAALSQLIEDRLGEA